MITDAGSDSSDWRFGALVTLLIVVGFGWIYRQSDIAARSADSVEPRTLSTLGAPEVQWSPPIVPASAAPKSDSILDVYECESEGERILSDQPCGPSAEVVQVMAPNRMKAHEPSGLYRDSRSSRSERRLRPAEAHHAAGSSICRHIEEQIQAINSRMRQAYRGSEGERFRHRLRELSDQRHAARCIR
jgi:hypothetical protein